MTTAVLSRLDALYAERFPESARLAERGKSLFPSGVTHDGRYLEPFPVYVREAHGSRKTTVEGHSLVDYWVGHGSLILGHSHPAVVEAVQRQMALGTHFSACHELEMDWAERVLRLLPAAERIRFTSSGTEATLMAIRIARLATGRRKVVKFIGHFHGWHDSLVPAAYAPYTPDDWSIPGVTDGVLSETVPIPPNDLAALEQALDQHNPACVIVEATGGHWGMVPVQGEFLRELRRLTAARDVLLIFDEVISGFRVHPGGSQGHYGIAPDMTTLAKILAGGLPGGALVGREDLLEGLAFENRFGKKMKHPGTYNGNPLSAAAGVAALDLVATGEPGRHSNRMAALLRGRLNALFAEKSVDWIAYGEFSMIHLLMGYEGPRPDRDDFIPCGGDYRKLDGKSDRQLGFALRRALFVGGVDWFGSGAMTSAAHTEADVDLTVKAFAQAIELLREGGRIS